MSRSWLVFQEDNMNHKFESPVWQTQIDASIHLHSFVNSIFYIQYILLALNHSTGWITLPLHGVNIKNLNAEILNRDSIEDFLAIQNDLKIIKKINFFMISIRVARQVYQSCYLNIYCTRIKLFVFPLQQNASRASQYRVIASDWLRFGKVCNPIRFLILKLLAGDGGTTGVALTLRAFNIALLGLWLRTPSSKCSPSFSVLLRRSCIFLHRGVYIYFERPHHRWPGLEVRLNHGPGARGYPNFVVIKRYWLVAQARGREILENSGFLQPK